MQYNCTSVLVFRFKSRVNSFTTNATRTCYIVFFFLLVFLKFRILFYDSTTLCLDGKYGQSLRSDWLSRQRSLSGLANHSVGGGIFWFTGGKRKNALLCVSVCVRANRLRERLGSRNPSKRVKRSPRRERGKGAIYQYNMATIPTSTRFTDEYQLYEELGK